MENIRIIFKIINISRKITPVKFYVAILSMVLVGTLPVVATVILSQIIEKVAFVTQGDVTFISAIPVLVIMYPIVIFVQESAEEMFASLTYLLLRYDISRYFINRVYKKINEVDLEFFENSNYADLKSRALDAYEWRPADLLSKSFGFISKLLSASIAGTAIFFTLPIQTIFIALFLIPSLIVDYIYQAGAWDIWTSDTQTRRKYGYLLGISNDQQAMYIKELRLLGLGDHFRGILINLVKSVHKKQKNIQHKRMIAKIFINIIPLTVIGFVMYSLTQSVISQNISLGTYTFVIGNIFIFKNKFTFALFELGGALTEANYVKNVFEFLRIKPSIVSPERAVSSISIPPKIEFRDVTFAYPGTNVDILNNFSLTIERKQKVAIVGENGAGKSTFIKLLLRFYDTQKGSILINDTDIKKLDLSVWRNKVAALLQDFKIFSMVTIADNIGYGNLKKYIIQKNKNKDEASVIDILQSATDAKANDFISQREPYYNSIVGREFDGRDFSGGELQRLAIARTFYKDAGLIIMDEPTSAVDAKAEMEIFKSLKDHLTDKTVIFISHRFSTVRIADRIIVVKNGKIVEDGTHKELLEKKGMYARMFRAQAKGYS